MGAGQFGSAIEIIRKCIPNLLFYNAKCTLSYVSAIVSSANDANAKISIQFVRKNNLPTSPFYEPLSTVFVNDNKRTRFESLVFIRVKMAIIGGCAGMGPLGSLLVTVNN